MPTGCIYKRRSLFSVCILCHAYRIYWYMEKPQYPTGVITKGRKRSELEHWELEAIRKYDREMRAYARATNPEVKQRDLEATRRHYANHREEKIKANSEWRKANWDKVYEQRKKSGLLAANQNRWYHSKGKFNVQTIIAELWRQKTRRAARGICCSKSTQRVLGCNQERLQIHLESLFQPGMTWENYGEWQVDHIKPCSSFDLTKDSDLLECFHYRNTQPLWQYQHSRKTRSELHNFSH